MCGSMRPEYNDITPAAMAAINKTATLANNKTMFFSLHATRVA